MLQEQPVVLNKKPSELSVELSEAHSLKFSKEQKKVKGQFFTPLFIAEYMSSLARLNRQVSHYRILDPGCGTLVLSTCLIEQIIQLNPGTKSISLDCFENDLSIRDSLYAMMDYLKRWLSNKEISLQINHSNEDFLLRDKGSQSDERMYDFVISNPPYFKLNNKDPRVINFGESLSGQQNIYALFLLESARLLKPNGQLIFLVPRSFTSGQYFESFRKSFFEKVDLDHVHVFDSRVHSFKADEVLQENVIVSGKNKISSNSCLISTVVSHSSNNADLYNSNRYYYPLKDVVSTKKKQALVYFPINENQRVAIEKFNSWNDSLESLGFKASTGPIVPYRSNEFLRNRFLDNPDLCPVIWPHNCQKMNFLWPNVKPKKPNWIINNYQSNSKTIENKDYIFLKRVSSKEDNSKLTATPYSKTRLKYESIGIENHVNYIHKLSGDFLKTELLGLCALYNSTLFDSYFRSFSGNTQVSVTELMNMPMPSLDVIKKIGLSICRFRNNQWDQEAIDVVVKKWINY